MDRIKTAVTALAIGLGFLILGGMLRDRDQRLASLDAARGVVEGSAS